MHREGYYEQLIPSQGHSTYGSTNRGSSKQCDAVRTCLRVMRVPPHEDTKDCPCSVPTAASHGQLPTCEGRRGINFILTNILRTDVPIFFFTCIMYCVYYVHIIMIFVCIHFSWYGLYISYHRLLPSRMGLVSQTLIPRLYFTYILTVHHLNIQGKLIHLAVSIFTKTLLTEIAFMINGQWHP